LLLYNTPKKFGKRILDLFLLGILNNLSFIDGEEMIYGMIISMLKASESHILEMNDMGVKLLLYII
jgi:hypothetical protein